MIKTANTINGNKNEAPVSAGASVLDAPLFRAMRERLRSERGVVFLVVLILSAIALAVMTALIYMITAGTQISGMEKRYKTALDAGMGGWETLNQVVALRGNTSDTNAFITNLNSFSLSAAITTDAACAGTNAGTTYTGLAAKLMSPTTAWSAACSKSLTIDPKTATSYDMKLELGASPKYTVYAKIADTIDGNSGGDEGLLKSGVVSTSGDVQVMQVPFLYTIEVDAENAANPSERAKLSVLYQY